MQPFRASILMTLSLLVLASSAKAQSVWIDAEPPTSLEYDAVPRPNGGSYHFLHDIEIGPSRDLPADGESHVWISGTMAYGGTRSIGLRAYPSVYDPTVNNRDRVEIRVVHGDSDSFALRNATTHYFGYAFMLHEHMEAPTGWLHVMQVWQRPAPGATPSGKVPLTVSLTSDLHLQAHARTHDTSNRFWLSEEPISKGEWHTLFYELRPSYNGDGRGGFVVIWLDGVEVGRWDDDWGNPPELGYTEYFDVRCGIYRQAQDTHTIIMYDAISYF